MKLRVAAAVVILLLSGVFGRAAFAQEVPLPTLPPPPAEAQPALGAVNPAGWAACDVGLSVAFAVILVPALVPGLPVTLPVALPVSPVTLVSAILGATNPVFAFCSWTGPRPGNRGCAVDDQVPSAPLIVLPHPASFLVNQAAALERAGVPAPTGDLAGQLGC